MTIFKYIDHFWESIKIRINFTINFKIKIFFKNKLIIVLLLLANFFCGCQIGYLTKSAYQQAWILSHRQPIEDVLKSKDLSEDERNKLELVLKARNFAKDDLKLNVNKSYKTYVKLDKPYVVWAVNASEKWKLEHYIWSYPIVGKLPYKGFPNEKDAIEEATSFDSNKYDTHIRGVTAYSTLGWFNDPLLSSMMRYSDYSLVNTIIHESTHATLFIDDHGDFNERLASFVGNKGAEQFYLKYEGSQSKTLEMVKSENEDEIIFSKFISKELKNLEEFYKSNTEKKESLRQEKFQQIKDRFVTEVKPNLKTKGYLQFEKVNLNNAKLLLYKTYIEDLNVFDRVFILANSSIPEFIQKMKALEKSKNPIQDLAEIK